jgi:hypothetical protein
MRLIDTSDPTNVVTLSAAEVDLPLQILDEEEGQ